MSRILLVITIILLAIVIVLATLLFGDTDVEVPVLSDLLATSTPQVVTASLTETPAAIMPTATSVVVAAAKPTEIPVGPTPTVSPVVVMTVQPTETPVANTPVPTSIPPATAIPPTSQPSTGTITGLMPDAQQVTNVTSGAFDPSWNPTGTNIAYLQWQSEGPCANRCSDIGLVNPDGTDQRILATGPGPAIDVGIGAFISWLGESNLLLTNERNHYHEYMTIDSTQAPFSRTVLNGDDEAFTRIMSVPGGMGGYGISSSRDGKFVLWRHQQGSYASIRIAPYEVLSGQNSNAVGTVLIGDEESSAAYSGGIALSPDGTSFVIAIKSDTASGEDLYVADSSGLGVLKRITASGDEGVLNRGPNFSPDGRFVAFHSLIDGQYDLAVYDLETEQEIRLTETLELSEANPSWSPDGTHLAYQSSGDGIPTNIFVAELATSIGVH